MFGARPLLWSAWIPQIAFARARILSQKRVVRGRVILISLLSIGIGEPLARGLSATQTAAVAPLAPHPSGGGQPVPRAWAPVSREPSALRRSAFGARPRLALAPSPYELAPARDLAPDPYGALAPLAPNPYPDQDAVGPARPVTSMLHGPSALRRSALAINPRLALAPSPYELGPPSDLAPNPY
ncbi:MAG: hypothetical protein ABI895_43130 [Deltaproteobacteria bacterium]